MFSRLERKHEKLAPVTVFAWRLVTSIGLGSIMVGAALLIGIAGYHWIAGFGWIDSILEASMILGGMGPVNPLPSQGSKLFAAGYALFSGLIFIGVMSIVLTPVMHRLLHRFHLEKSGSAQD
jgi:hypothetical protein